MVEHNSPTGILGYTPVCKDVQSADAQSATTIWDPTSGTKFVITDIIVSTDTALTFTFKDGSTTFLVVYLAATGGFVSNFKTPIVSATADNLFTITASGSGNVNVTACGYEI